MSTEMLLEGLIRVFSVQNILWIAFGVFLGMVGGTLPGISGVTMLAVILPLMYKMPIDTVVLAIIGIYAASTYSSSTAGALYNIPGGAPGVPTTIEGYRLTLQGRASEALAADIGASFFGNTFGVVAMIAIIPLFQYIITMFGTAERALFALWALVIIAVGVLTREDPVKGLASMGIGLTIAAVGSQGNLGVIRYAGRQMDLWDGFHILWIVLGLFAIPQLMRLPQMKDVLEKVSTMERERAIETPLEYYKLTFSMITKNVWYLFKCSTLGTIIGIIPGIGALTSGWLAYSYSQRAAKRPELVGKGSYEAILAVESANNAAVPGALIPLFALGIPGSASAAIILGAFMLAGLYPGPQMLQQSGDLVWTIIFGIFICGVAFLAMAYPFRLMAGSLIRLPIHILVAVIGALAMLGSYLAKFSVYGANVTLLLALLAVALNSAGVSIVGVLLGTILGSVIEIDMIRSYQVGGLLRFTAPASLVLLAIIIFTLATGVYRFYIAPRRKNKKGEGKAEALQMVGHEGKGSAEGQDELGRLLVGIALIALGIWVWNGSYDYPFLAALWPRVVCVLFIFAPALILIIQALAYRQKLKLFFATKKVSSKEEAKKKLDGWMIFAGLAVCNNLIPVLGFIESATLFALAITMYMNSKKPLQNVLITLAVGLFVWVLKVGFDFVLPVGLLGI